MSTFLPVSIPSQQFHPLANSSATSLTEYLPPGQEAVGLLFNCDARKILYTLYSEQDNGELST
jgi:hypothetical protein